MKVGVYYDAWSGHEGGNLSAYVEGLTEPQHIQVQLDSLSKVKYANGLIFMALVTINITGVSVFHGLQNVMSSPDSNISFVPQVTLG